MQRYTNPLKYRGGETVLNPDPFVLQYGGTFYCYSTAVEGVQVSSSPDLVSWDYHGFAYQEVGRDSYWAPCVTYRNGVFYLYVSNRPEGSNDEHLQRMRVARSGSPLGPFTFVAPMEDFFLIDADVVSGADGKDYMFYAANEFTEFADRPGTALILDGMKDPVTLAESPRPVVVPTLDEEIFAEDRFGDGRDWHTIEGGAYFERRNLAYMTYSGNAYVRENYFIGYATSPLEPSVGDTHWTKHPDDDTYVPLIRRNSKVEGTGHNSITRAPNLVDWWIVYHGRDADEPLLEDVEQRQMRIDPLHFNDDTMFALAPTATAQPDPWQPSFLKRFVGEHTQSGWSTVRGGVRFVPGKAALTPGTLALLGEPAANYVAEVSLRTRDPFGLVPLLVSQDEYVQVTIHPSEKNIAVETVTSGRVARLAERQFACVEFAQWQTVRIEKMGDSLTLRVGNQVLIEFDAPALARQGLFGLTAEGDLEVNSVALTEHFDWFLQTDGQPIFDLDAVAPLSNSADEDVAVRVLPPLEGGVRVELDIAADRPEEGFASIEVLGPDGNCVASICEWGDGYEGQVDLGNQTTHQVQGRSEPTSLTIAITATDGLVTLRVGQELHTWSADRSRDEKYFTRISTRETRITGLTQTNIKTTDSKTIKKTMKRSVSNDNK